MSSEARFRSDMTVELKGSIASDFVVASRARVSTDPERALSLQERSSDKGLIHMLLRDRHGSPFEHAVFSFYIEAPIFVWREFMRHRIASYNEESGRYKELRPVFYIPGDDRNMVQVGRPGKYSFEPGTAEQRKLVQDTHRESSAFAYEGYRTLLDAGVAREVARLSLPLNIYSSAFVTINARSLMNFLSLRTKREGSKFPSFPQREIEMVAERMEEVFANTMPMTYEAFNNNGRVAP